MDKILRFKKTLYLRYKQPRLNLKAHFTQQRLSRFCSLFMESVELSLDLSLLFSCVKHVLGRFSIVPCEFLTSVFRCSPLDLWSFMVNSVDLGLGCSPLDLRSTMVELGLPCISSVFWIDGSIFSVIALLIASCIWKFKLCIDFIQSS